MKFFALDEWEAAKNAALPPPYWHAQSVPDVFTAICGILWSVSYVLMVIRSFKEKTYSMPIYCLCFNMAWEVVYGFIYGTGLLNQIVFGQWVIIDAFLVYATVKYGKNEWRHQPLVAKNLAWIIAAGIALALYLDLAIVATFVPVIGQQVIQFAAWPIQFMLSVGSIAQILSRGNSAGHSFSIWITRALGTVAAGCGLHWQAYYWPELCGYAWTPFFTFLVFGSFFFDCLYPFVLIYVRKHQKGGVDTREATDNFRADEKKWR